MRRLMGLGLMLIACGLPASTANGWEIERARAIAETVWKVCPGTLSIQAVTLSADAASYYREASGWATEGVCTVDINMDHQAMREWEPFCSTVLHEVGHVARFRDPTNQADPYHSSNPDSVMAASPLYAHIGGRWYGTDPRCRRRGRPFLVRHGLLKPRPSRRSSRRSSS